MLKRILAHFYALSVMGFTIPFMAAAETVGVFSDNSIAQIKFAAGDIKSALELEGYTVEMFPLSSLNAKYSKKKVVIALSSNAEVTKLLTSEGGIIPSGLGEHGIRIL